MTIVLNGQSHHADEGGSVLALLESLGLAPGRVAVELNGQVLKREDFVRAVLHDDDAVEVVQFVGGG